MTKMFKMGLLNRRNLLDRRALWTTAALGSASQATLVAVVVTLAAKSASPDSLTYRLALAASFLEILAMPASITSLWLRQRRMSRRIQFIPVMVFVFLAVAAAILTMFTLVWIWQSFHRNVRADNFSKTQALTAAGFAVWGATIVFQSILGIMLLWPEESDFENDRPAVSMEEHGDLATPAYLTKRSASAQSTFVASNSLPDVHADSQPVSSAFSAYSTSPRVSFRNSVTKVMKPVTSKTRILFQHSFVLPDLNSTVSGRGTPTEISTRNEGFESRDSRVSGFGEMNRTQEYTKREPARFSASRSGSPADALYHPFPAYSTYPVLSPVMSSSSISSSAMTITRPASRGQSNTSQSHIHPLFRSESPTPRPLTSPDTVITASPYAGQIVSREHQSFGPRRWHSVQGLRAEGSVSRSPVITRQSSLQRHQLKPFEQTRDELMF